MSKRSVCIQLVDDIQLFKKMMDIAKQHTHDDYLVYWVTKHGYYVNNKIRTIRKINKISPEIMYINANADIVLWTNGIKRYVVNLDSITEITT